MDLFTYIVSTLINSLGSNYMISSVSAVTEQKYLNVTWDDFNKRILQLSLTIAKSKWEPDHIVCIGRGGLYPGDALSRLFKKPLGVVMCSSYGGESEMQQGRLNIAEDISITTKLSGKVLLVDDLVDTGKTLLALSQKIQEKSADVLEIRTAVIFKKTLSQFNPDYYQAVVEKGIWIYLPNEVFDHVDISKIPNNLLRNFSESSLLDLSEQILENLPKNPTQKLPANTLPNLALNLLYTK